MYRVRSFKYYPKGCRRKYPSADHPFFVPIGTKEFKLAPGRCHALALAAVLAPLRMDGREGEESGPLPRALVVAAVLHQVELQRK